MVAAPAKESAADRLVLAAVHQRLDWIDTTSETCVAEVLRMKEEGLIEGFAFSKLKVKVNGKWFDRP